MTDENLPGRDAWLKSLEGNRETSIKYEDITPYDLLKRRAKNEPNDPMLIFPKGKTMSYGDVMNDIERMAAHFQHLGIVKGDKIALLLPNTPHYVVGHYAALAIGAVVVQANPLYTEHELTHQIKDSGAKGIVSLTMFQDKVNSVMGKTNLEFAVYGQIQTYLGGIVRFLGKLLKKSVFDPKSPKFDAPVKSHPNAYYYGDFITNDYAFSEVEVDYENDIAILQYTGGTTGVSKGAMLTHKNVSVNAQQARASIHMVPDKTGSVLTVLPMFHVFGLTACMNLAIQLGIPQVLNVASPPDFGDILGWIEKYQITFFPGVPAMMNAIVSHPKAPSTDFSSLIAVISGGAPLPIETARQFHKVTGAHLVEGYGLSETAPLTHINPIGVPDDQLVEGSIGLPAADTLCKVVDQGDYSKTLPVGEVGELCLKGPQIFKGYYGMENETKNALKDDGWFKTGDIARIDEAGYTYIVDRMKDIIIVSGYNVVPREVEEILYQHPAILEAAVAGMTHPKKGEMVASWVVLKEGQEATEESVREYCKEYLAPYKVPRVVTFKDELPKSMVGKILRRKLQEEGLEEEKLS